MLPKQPLLTLLPDRIVVSPHHDNWQVDQHFKVDTSPAAVVPISAMNDQFKHFGGVEFFSTKEKVLRLYQVTRVTGDEKIIENLGGEVSVQVGLRAIYYSLKSVSPDRHYLFYTQQLMRLWSVCAFWNLGGWDISACLVQQSCVYTDEPVVISEVSLGE